MNKKQLIAKLSEKLSQSKADAERTFDIITNTILDALKGDDSVKIAGFGTYKVAKKKLELEEIQEQVNKFRSVLLKKLNSYLQKHLKKFSIDNSLF